MLAAKPACSAASFSDVVPRSRLTRWIALAENGRITALLSDAASKFGRARAAYGPKGARDGPGTRPSNEEETVGARTCEAQLRSLEVATVQAGNNRIRRRANFSSSRPNA